MTELFTLNEAAARLHRSPRALRDWLFAHPCGLDGKPLYMQMGRAKLFSADDLVRIESLARHLTRQAIESSRPLSIIPRHVQPNSDDLWDEIERLTGHRFEKERAAGARSAAKNSRQRRR